jgi:hypothetical protein
MLYAFDLLELDGEDLRHLPRGSGLSSASIPHGLIFASGAVVSDAARQHEPTSTAPIPSGLAMTGGRQHR